MEITDEMVEAAWEAFSDCPVDMCGDHDEEQKKCVVAALAAALSSLPHPQEAEPIGYCVWINGKLAGCAKSHRGAFPVYASPALAAQTADAVPVAIKPLEWGDYPNPHFAGPDVTVANFDTFGSMKYQAQRDPWALSYVTFLAPQHGTLFWESKGHQTIEEAKLAAQADYERRIRSALEPSP